MALYAIGDVQGCFSELLRLLDEIDFDASKDRLWFTGDLVNRGPKSLETLRWVRELGDNAITVLGNHDLHLLAVSRDPSARRKRDSLEAVLDAPDREELIDWLRHRPLSHHDGRFCLVHAGLPPQWDLIQTQACALEVESILRGPDYGVFLRNMYGDKPDIWSDSLSGWDRLRFITNCFTRLRYCDLTGKIDLTENGSPGSQRKGLHPWFEIPWRKTADLEVVFGHWSTLGFHVSRGCFGIDTGCLWGGQLTALRLDGEMYRTSIDCPAYRRP